MRIALALVEVAFEILLNYLLYKLTTVPFRSCEVTQYSKSICKITVLTENPIQVSYKVKF